MSQRTQIWNNLASTKFKACLMSRCAKWSEMFGRWYSVIVVIGTASCVAAWAIWQQYPIVWAIIVGLAQLLHLVKPYVPYIGKEKEYTEASFKLERLFLEFDKLWKDFNRGELNDAEVDQRIHELQSKYLDIDEKIGISCPDFKKHKDKAYDDMVQFLNLNYQHALV